MAVGTILALVIAITIMLFPVALIWYINIGGFYLAIKEARERRVEQERATEKAKA